VQLDDNDIMASIKEWSRSTDFVLRELSNRLINRQLLKIKMQNDAFASNDIESILAKTSDFFGFNNGEETYFVIHDSIANHAYNPESDNINLLYKDGSLQDIRQAADQHNISALSGPVVKHFVCFPAEIRKGFSS
jgi:hypothetical protein